MHVLHPVIKNLKESRTTDWKSGGLKEWSAYANRMHRSIQENTEILKTAAVQWDAMEAEIMALKARLVEKDQIIATLAEKVK